VNAPLPAAALASASLRCPVCGVSDRHSLLCPGYRTLAAERAALARASRRARRAAQMAWLRRRVAAMVASPRRDIALLAHDLEGSGLTDECRGIDGSDECDGATDGSPCWRHAHVWEIAARLVRWSGRGAVSL
jgi:hypothetical protein